MSFRTSVTIVASPRPRVGKTLLARLLTDFHVHEGRDAAGFDLNAGDNTLAQFLPEHAVTASISDIRGQMALFDSLVAADDRPKVVDLAAGSFDAFFALAAQIGFAEETRGRGIAPAILYVLTPDATSIEAWRNLRRRFPQIALAPVHNEMFGPSPPRDKYGLSASDPVVRLPMLAPALRKYIDAPPFSFAGAQMANATGIPLAVHIELQRWLRTMYAEFRELDRRIVQTDLTSAGSGA